MKRRVLAAAVVLFALLGSAAAWLAWPVDVPGFAAVKAQWTPSEAYLLDRNGEVIDQERIDLRVRRFEWTALDAVSPALIAAIVDGEDRRFWQHSGVDWSAVLAAIRDHGVSDRRRGASTISMQVAALLDPRVRAGSADGAWQRKLQQMRMARALESSWSKRQILEAYLNLLGFRGELQGISATSHVLAGKAPSGLSLPESLVLAALLPSPRASSASVVSRACARAAARKVFVGCEAVRTAADDMLAGLASTDTRRKASATPAAITIRAAIATRAEPQLAPQLAHALLRTPGARVRTTLDGGLQRLATGVLREHLANLSSQNVRDGAVLVVDNESGDVLAYVASAGPRSRARNVDGIRARRQAGSTLKPFLYELALER